MTYNVELLLKRNNKINQKFAENNNIVIPVDDSPKKSFNFNERIKNDKEINNINT